MLSGNILAMVVDQVVKIAPHLGRGAVENALADVSEPKLYSAYITLLKRISWSQAPQQWFAAADVRDWIESLPPLNELARLVNPTSDQVREELFEEPYRTRSHLPDYPSFDRYPLGIPSYRAPVFTPPPVFAVYVSGAIGGLIGLALCYFQVIDWPLVELTFAGLVIGAIIGSWIAAAEANS